MEWTVVTVLVVLVGLIAAVVKPLLTLYTTITRLSAGVDALEKNLKAQNERYEESSTRLADHELRLRVMESKKSPGLG